MMIQLLKRQICSLKKHNPTETARWKTARFGQSVVVQRTRFFVITVSLALYLTQIYVTKNGFSEGGIAGIRAAEVSATEIRAAEIRAAVVLSPKVTAAEIRSPEILAAEVRVPTVSVAEVRAARVRSPEIRAPDVPLRKIFFGHESD
jgi:hypothetical protein